jgi:hypothetical protein
VNVTASSPTITYGDAQPTITASYSPDIAPSTPATCITTYNQGDAAGGSYTTSCSGASDPSYTFNYFDGTVTVNQAPVVVTATGAALTYGDAKPTITVLSYSPSISPAVGATCDTTYVEGAGAASYPSSCSGASDPNYSFSYVDGSVSVAKRHLQVTADDKVIAFGEAPPAYTFAITSGNFYTGDGWGPAPTCDSIYAQNDPAGPYTITCSGGSAGSNYTVGYSPGTLTVNP